MGGMKRLVTVLLAATLTACSGGGTTTSQSAPQPVTVETTITEAPTTQSAPQPVPVETTTTKAPASVKPSTSSATSTASTPPQTSKDDLVQQMIDNPGVGAQLTINGQKATTCVYGDGFGLHMVAAGENTSCEFATAVMQEQTQDLNATDQNVRDHLKSPVDVVSPVTKKSYTMQCSTAPSMLITCTGGNNATVFLF